jgi:hypothetical protein
MEKVQKPAFTDYNAPSSEPFRLQVFLSLGIIIFSKVGLFNDTRLVIRPMIRCRARKIDNTRKHLTHFPAVTLRALC